MTPRLSITLRTLSYMSLFHQLCKHGLPAPKGFGPRPETQARLKAGAAKCRAIIRKPAEPCACGAGVRMASHERELSA